MGSCNCAECKQVFPYAVTVLRDKTHIHPRDQERLGLAGVRHHFAGQTFRLISRFSQDMFVRFHGPQNVRVEGR